MAKAHGVHGSSSTTNLPAIKGGKGGGGHQPAAHEAFRRGQPAPGLQRLMQTSFTDTWKKPVAMPHGSARGKGGDASSSALLSPRSGGLARSGAAQVTGAARAEHVNASEPCSSTTTARSRLPSIVSRFV